MSRARTTTGLGSDRYTYQNLLDRVTSTSNRSRYEMKRMLADIELRFRERLLSSKERMLLVAFLKARQS
jgi:hypothetical protein